MKTDDFLAAFFPDENEPIHLRGFKPREAPETPDNYAKKLTATRAAIAHDAATQAELKAMNRTRGMYFAVNSGGDHDAAITGGKCPQYAEKKCPIEFHEPGRFNAWFAESDTATIEEQRAALDTAPILPSIRAETKKSIHAYWLIAGDCTESEWREIQARLIAFFGGDEKIKNPSRVMRLPGFDHLSADGSRKRVECVVFEPERRHTAAEMLAAFPAVTKSQQKNTQAGNGCKRVTAGEFATWDALRAELGRRIMAHESAKKNSTGKWDCRAICHDGKGVTGLFYDPATNQAYCNSRCEQSVMLRAFSLPERPVKASDSTDSEQGAGRSSKQPADEDAKKQRKSQADELTQLAQSVELFHCPEEDASFASFSVKNHRETHRLNSKAFRHYLAHLYYRQTGKVPNAEALQSTLSCLEGKARYEGEQRPTFLRLAAFGECIYWDLCNADWEVVEISAAGWRVIPAAQAPARFRRTRGMQPLPTPISGGSLDELKRFINYPNTMSWVLHSAY